MHHLVQLHDGQPVTTSLAIAEGAELDHASVIKLVRTYLADLEEFGLVGFEIRARLAGQHGGGDTEYALLNEQQATLLFTFMRNSAPVILFKKRLVKAFFDLAQQQRSGGFSVPQTMPEALRLAAEALEQKAVAEARAAALEYQTVEQQAAIDAAKPKVQFYDAFRNADGLYGLDNAARALNIPPRRFTRALYDQRFLFREGGVLVPYAEHRDKAIFHVKVTMVDDKARHQTFITPKGLTYFSRRFSDLIQHPQLELAS